MGGGLLQLVAYGAQDIYLTGNPQITFFKVVYRRHTNFSMEAISQSFNGTPDFGNTVNCTISRNGDLIYKMYVQVTLPSITVSGSNKFRWLNWLGHILIKEVEIHIGGHLIDKQYGEWLHIWNELSQKTGLKEGYANMVGNVPRLTQFVSNHSDNNDPILTYESSTSNDMPTVTLYIPLQFWFCRNPGLALPLVALQYHDVTLNIKFNELANCRAGDTATIPSLGDTQLYVDYIYLDTDERRRFAQSAHEYLIEQVQYNGIKEITTVKNKIELTFDHPIKEIVWVVQKDSVIETPSSNNNDTAKHGGQQWFNFTDKIDKTFYSGIPGDPLGGGLSDPYRGSFPLTKTIASDIKDITTVTTNGIPSKWSDMITANMGIHGAGVIGDDQTISSDNFGNLEIYDSGLNPTRKAKLILNGTDRFSERDGRYFNLVQPYQHHTNIPSTGINVYSFALDPEDHQPSGACNFSRIESAELELTVTNKTLKDFSGDSTSAKVKIYGVGYNVLRIMSGMGGLAYSN
tara:strand:+ start:109 stop:1659 length:1551 start_codon:yes stop_codon:yes gene_type:complete